MPPFRIVLKGEWNAAEVEVLEGSPRPLPWPDSHRAQMDAAWNQLQSENPHLFDGELAALEKAVAANGRLALHLFPSSYRQLMYSNRHAEEWKAAGREAWLCRVLGISSVVETRDGRMLFMLRSEDVGECPGCFDVFGGHIDWRAHRNARGPIDVFLALRREICDELGITEGEIVESVCIGLGENHKNHKPELLFRSRLTLHAEEVAKRARTAAERFEYVRLLAVGSAPDALRRWIDANVQRIAPSAQANLQAFLEYAEN